MVLATDPSTVARPMVAVSDSRVNHATRIPSSMALWAIASTKWLLPVPEGPATARFSARPIHSRVASPDWVPGGIEESPWRQEVNVLPAGSPALLRRIRRVASSRPVTSSASTRTCGCPKLGTWSVTRAFVQQFGWHDRAGDPWPGIRDRSSSGRWAGAAGLVGCGKGGRDPAVASPTRDPAKTGRATAADVDGLGRDDGIG